MRYPWANILLLLFILADMLSGFFGLISGSRGPRHIHPGPPSLRLRHPRRAGLESGQHRPILQVAEEEACPYSIHDLGSSPGRDPSPRPRMVHLRRFQLVDVQWSELAHLHRRCARSPAPLARLVHVQGPAYFLLGRAPVSAKVRRPGCCRASRLGSFPKA